MAEDIGEEEEFGGMGDFPYWDDMRRLESSRGDDLDRLTHDLRSLRQMKSSAIRAANECSIGRLTLYLGAFERYRGRIASSKRSATMPELPEPNIEHTEYEKRLSKEKIANMQKLADTSGLIIAAATREGEGLSSELARALERCGCKFTELS